MQFAEFVAINFTNPCSYMGSYIVSYITIYILYILYIIAGHDLCCTGNNGCVSSCLYYHLCTVVWKLTIYVATYI